MKAAQLTRLRFFSLLLLFPGLAGLVLSAVLSTHYLDTLPTAPSPEELRIVPRNIHGTVVYQTVEEDRQLTIIEYSSVGIFLFGLGLSLVYLEQWGELRAGDAGDDELAERAG